jgi:hypothetical protein
MVPSFKKTKSLYQFVKMIELKYASINVSKKYASTVCLNTGCAKVMNDFELVLS